MSSWLIELAGKLWRRMPPGVRRWGVLLSGKRFTVTAGAVVIDERGRVLLLKHRFRTGCGWGIPGGFIHSREHPQAAVRRELQEELGLKVEAVELAFIRTLQKYDQVEIIFRCVPRGEFEPKNHEIRCAEWFALDSLPQGLTDDQQALINRALGHTETRNLSPET